MGPKPAAESPTLVFCPGGAYGIAGGPGQKSHGSFRTGRAEELAGLAPKTAHTRLCEDSGNRDFKSEEKPTRGGAPNQDSEGLVENLSVQPSNKTRYGDFEDVANAQESQDCDGAASASDPP